MGRPRRADEAGGIYHALNRGNARAEIFRKPENYNSFERILADGTLGLADTHDAVACPLRQWWRGAHLPGTLQELSDPRRRTLLHRLSICRAKRNRTAAVPGERVGAVFSGACLC